MQLMKSIMVRLNGDEESMFPVVKASFSTDHAQISDAEVFRALLRKKAEEIGITKDVIVNAKQPVESEG